MSRLLKWNGNFLILILAVLCEGIIQNNFLTIHSPKRIWFYLVPGVLHLGYIYICFAKRKIWANLALYFLPIFSLQPESSSIENKTYNCTSPWLSFLACLTSVAGHSRKTFLLAQVYRLKATLKLKR